MRVEEVMSRKIHSVEPQASLSDAADRMKKFNVGILPVVDSGEVVGVVSDRDIVVRAVAAGKDPRTAPVREAMTSGPVWCRADCSLEEAARIMKEKRIRRLLVSDRQDKPVGVVSLGDLASCAEGRTQAGEVLAEVCKELRRP